jgi:hypothetical protein
LFWVIIQSVGSAHTHPFNSYFDVDLLINVSSLLPIKIKESSKMSDSSHTHSYFLWHIARILLTLAIVGLPILGGMYGVSVLL